MSVCPIATIGCPLTSSTNGRFVIPKRWFYESWITSNQHEAEWDRYRTFTQSWKGSVVELGCGTGRFTRKIYRPELTITAIDFSEASLELAKKSLPNTISVSFRIGDVRNLQLPDSSADHVMSIQVYEHLIEREDAQMFFREIARILKPGGTALVSGYALTLMDLLLGHKASGPGGIQFVRYPVADLRQFAHEAGMEFLVHSKAILFTRRPFNLLAGILSDKVLLALDKMLSPLCGPLWGSIIVFKLKKPLLRAK